MQQSYTSGKLKYLLHIPSVSGDTKLPLILFLHGSGERGNDSQFVKKWGLPRELETRPDFPFLVISPQCPANKRWSDLDAEVLALLKEITNKYPADRSRCYLTGFSMGGEGTWHFAVEHPELWAAVAPVAGHIPQQAGFLKRLCVLKSTPVWIFHGALDEAVPLSGSQIPTEALRECGGDVRFTEYPDLGHGATSDETYRNDNLYAWFLEHQKTPKS